MSKQKKKGILKRVPGIGSEKKYVQCICGLLVIVGLLVVFALIIPTAPGEPVETCTANWECEEWSECSIEGEQTRICLDSQQCEPTNIQKTETRECKLSDDVIKKTAVKVSYTDLLRYNEEYEGKIVYYKGIVAQVGGNYEKNEYWFLCVIIPNEKVAYVNWSGTRVLEEDFIQIWGTVKGLKSYETVSGTVETVPEIDALILELNW